MNEWMNGGNELKGQNPRGIIFFYLHEISLTRTHTFFIFKKTKFFIFEKGNVKKERRHVHFFLSTCVCAQYTLHTRKNNNNKAIIINNKIA